MKLNVKRLVVKVGTSSLLHNTGKIDIGRIDLLARELADISASGVEVILVTSGAIGVGLCKLGMEKPKSIAKKQALAAIGQVTLMHLYNKFFGEYGQVVGQVLLSKENFLEHEQYLNAKTALNTMLDMNIIPIINENDAISTSEMKIGDNDTLSATVAALVDADMLIILSDIDGLYNANPTTNPAACLLGVVRDITPEIENMAGGAGSSVGTGGMQTKIEAAKVGTSVGISVVIAKSTPYNVKKILDGEKIGTLFLPKETHVRERKNWLAFGKRIKGLIKVDAGCEVALQKGSSLLAVGVKEVEGTFTKGDTLRVLSLDGREIARGTADFDNAQIQAFLETKAKDKTVIHRDNLLLMI